MILVRIMNNESTFRIEKFLVFAKSILRVRYRFMFVRSALHEFRVSYDRYSSSTSFTIWLLKNASKKISRVSDGSLAISTELIASLHVRTGVN